MGSVSGMPMAVEQHGDRLGSTSGLVLLPRKPWHCAAPCPVGQVTTCAAPAVQPWHCEP